MTKPTYAAGLLLAALATFSACKKSNSDQKPPSPPHITSFSPLSAAKDSTVTIHGTGFSSSTSGNVVSFNGRTAIVSSANDTILKVVVPAGTQDGRISVKVGDQTDTSTGSFKYVYTISLLAGSTYGYADGKGADAKFNSPTGLAIDATGNLFVTDMANHLVRKVTPDGTVSTFAGTYNNSTIINQPSAATMDASGNIYVSNITSGTIGKISPAGTITSYAGDGSTGYKNGAAAQAEFYALSGITVDPSGNLYIADGLNHVIRKIDPSGNVTTFAGDHHGGYKDGSSDIAEFDFPIGVTMDAKGNLFVIDQVNNMVRKITPSGMVSTLAGSGQGATTDGTGTAAAFNNPIAGAVDSHGNVFVTEFYGASVRKVTSDGVVTTINGTHAVYTAGASINDFSQPYAIVVDANGAVYVADESREKILKIQ